MFYLLVCIFSILMCDIEAYIRHIQLKYGEIDNINL